MAVETTGSLVMGMVDGLNLGITGPNGPTITYVAGDPDGLLTVCDASGLAIDWTNGNIYINKIANGSTWYSLGSKS